MKIAELDWLGYKLPKNIIQVLDRAKTEEPTSRIAEELLALLTHWSVDPESALRMPDSRASKKWHEIAKRENLISSPALPKSLKESQLAFGDLLRSSVPFPPPEKPTFTFIDLFAGIGGFRMALQNLGGKCVFSSEWNQAAQQTYFRNYGELPFGDIRKFTSPEISDAVLKRCIPEHDVLCAGFPCQPFSHAGVSSRVSLGRSHGFECTTQGTLFFDLVRIAKVTRPKVLFLENVRNLMRHDGGKTFSIIQETIEKDLGYSFFPCVVDARTTVPQKRVRCFMVCVRDETVNFKFPSFEGTPLPLSSILEPLEKVSEYTISDQMWAGHQRRTKTNIARGAGFTTYAARLDEPSNTIVARYWKDGKECLIPQKGKNPRILTPRECARLQGYPEEFILPASKKHSYMQMGNSVVVPVVEKIAQSIVDQIL
jgi:DNA (cytosine-5)-methyltransferase 1